MVLFICAIILIVLGILCCFVNKVPGPVIAWLGMLLLKFTAAGALMAWWIVILCGVIAIASIFLIRFLVPIVKDKVPTFGKGGTWGTIIGSILAVLMSLGAGSLVLPIVYLIVFPCVFAFVFELISQKNFGKAGKATIGAYSIFATTTLIKLIICIVMLYLGMKLMVNDNTQKVEDAAQEVYEEVNTECTESYQQIGTVADESDAEEAEETEEETDEYGEVFEGAAGALEDAANEALEQATNETIEQSRQALKKLFQ